MPRSLSRRPDERVNWRSSIPFFGAHAVLGLIFVTGVTRSAVYIFVVLYLVRMLAITAGYHRYFSHRSYVVRRPTQFVMALIGTTAAQKGPLWWASHHRRHHRFTDTEGDVHSPQKGFWWSHVGWILADKYKQTDLSAVPDLAAFPELRFLDRHNDFGWRLLALSTFLIGGWSGLIFGFFGSTVLLWHVTFSINSLSHTLGKRRYATPDTSRNNLILALATFGEGWHNNHHHYQPSARQGFYWWEIDLTWYLLRALRLVGLVSRLRQPPAETLVRNRICDGAFDLGMFRASWRRLAAPTLRSSPAAKTPSEAPIESAPDALADDAVGQRRAALEQALAGSLQAAEDLATTKRKTDARSRTNMRRHLTDVPG